MRALITGATGLIGAHLVRVLLERQVRVRIFRRQSSPLEGLSGLDIEHAVGSLDDPESLRQAMRDVSQVYHLAGSFETGANARASLQQVLVEGTRAVGEAAGAAGVRRLVLCSSSITLPFGPKEAPAHEDAPDPFEGRAIPYQGALLAYYQARLEQEAVGQALNTAGLETVTVNPDFVLGPWDIKPASGAILLQVAKLPWIPAYPPGGKCFIHARDCALGHVGAMEHGIPGTRYLLGDHNLSYGEALTVMARVVGRPRPGWPLPKAILPFATGIEGWLAGWLPEGAALSSRLEPAFIGRYRSPERARSALGLGSTPFERTVEETWAWFQGRLRR